MNRGRLKNSLSTRAAAARTIAVLAAILGVGNAAFTAYWALGGTWLLDTVGGEVERWGRQRSAAVLLTLSLIALFKCNIALAAPIIVRRPGWLASPMADRISRLAVWTAAALLTGYGAVLTGAGLLVQSRLIEAGPDSDSRALAWHAYLWDPWFLGWGLTLLACLWLSRARVKRTRAPEAKERSG